MVLPMPSQAWPAAFDFAKWAKPYRITLICLLAASIVLIPFEGFLKVGYAKSVESKSTALQYVSLCFGALAQVMGVWILWRFKYYSVLMWGIFTFIMSIMDLVTCIMYACNTIGNVKAPIPGSGVKHIAAKNGIKSEGFWQFCAACLWIIWVLYVVQVIVIFVMWRRCKKQRRELQAEDPNPQPEMNGQYFQYQTFENGGGAQPATNQSSTSATNLTGRNFTAFSGQGNKLGA